MPLRTPKAPERRVELRLPKWGHQGACGSRKCGALIAPVDAFFCCVNSPIKSARRIPLRARIPLHWSLDRPTI